MSKKNVKQSEVIAASVAPIATDAEFQAALAEAVKTKAELVIRRAEGLNYVGKRMDSSRLAVIQVVSDELELSFSEVHDIIVKHFTNPENKPKPKKREAKEKAPDLRPISGGSIKQAEEDRASLEGRRFIITAAQNNTDVHTPFLLALEHYAAHINAQLIVMPFLYNKNGFQNGEAAEGVWYDPAIKPYMLDSSVWLGLNSKVALMAFNILPTVKAPLSGLREAIGSAEAMIVPHATIAHENIPVLGAQFGRVVPGMYSTGAVTQRNYIQQQAGQKAEGRHSFGAALVEFNENGQFWVRQLETDESGAFQDLRNVVWPSGLIDDIGGVSALNYGDIHAEKLDKRLAARLWAGNGAQISMLDELRPSHQFMHDLLDFSALNHHNRENHYHMAKNQVTNASVAKDLQDVINVLQDVSRHYCETIVVRSNHDDALDRWLADNKYEPRKDPVNAKFYYQLQVAAYAAIEVDQHFDSLPIALDMLDFGRTPSNLATFLRASQSFILNGVEHGEHGHSGINGSRGSPKQFAPSQMTTGHTHTSSIYGGCYTAGVTGKLAMGYNETGASSWTQSTVVLYGTGKRAILHVKDDGAGDLDWCARD